MALKDMTPVAQEKLIAILKEEGVHYTEQSGFIRVEGPTGRRLYIANTQKVRRVDLSGFTIKHGAHAPASGEFGRVKQQLDFSLPEDKVLANFQQTVRYMMALQPSETARKLPERQDAWEPAGQKVASAAGKKKIPVLGADGAKKKAGGKRVPAPRPSA